MRFTAHNNSRKTNTKPYLLSQKSKGRYYQKIIASLTQIVYIAFVKSEPINEKIVQKGKAISKLDNAGTFQT
ncbi:5119_t:CDS:1, partial [Ambispora gerdemannii]